MVIILEINYFFFFVVKLFFSNLKKHGNYFVGQFLSSYKHIMIFILRVIFVIDTVQSNLF